MSRPAQAGIAFETPGVNKKMNHTGKGPGYRLKLHIIIPVLYFGALAIAYLLKLL